MIDNLYVVSAILGNWWGESHINPGIWEGLKVGAPGYGLGQWTDNSQTKRRTALANWLHDHGYAFDSAEGQIRYFIEENTWYSVRHAKDFKKLSDFLSSSSKDLEYLTYAFLEGWEGIWDGTQTNRLNHAKDLLNYLQCHLDDEETGWISGNRYLSDEEVHHNAVLAARIFMGKTNQVFNASFSLAKTAAICADAKKTKTYGNSRSKIPCADGKISCDRMLARSDWDANQQLGLGMPEQEVGGYTVVTMEAYYNSTGLFSKITDSNALAAGDRVLMRTVGESSPSATWHTYQIAAFRSVNDIDKYDLGSPDRINAGGFFSHVPVNEWGNKEFYAAWRLKTDIQNGGNSNVTTISNCGHDENGGYVNGAAGDQTGQEWVLKEWYNRPWNYILRYPVREAARLAAQMAKNAALNDLIGYDQNQRTTFYDHLAASNWKPEEITIPCEGDCSETEIAIWIGVGYRLGIKPLTQMDRNGTTRDIRQMFANAGFQVLTGDQYTATSDNLLPGDVLLYEGHHVATNITCGRNVTDDDQPATTWNGIGTATCSADTYANVRQGPSTDYTILRKVNKGDRFEIDGKVTGDWTHVNVSGTIGWMSSSLVSMDGAPQPAPQPVQKTYPIGSCTKDGSLMYQDALMTVPVRTLNKGNAADIYGYLIHTADGKIGVISLDNFKE